MLSRIPIERVAPMIEKEIFNIRTNEDFRQAALKVFQFQYQQVNVYRKFCNALSINIDEIDRIEKIPFLPIQFFKSHQVIAKDQNPALTFESSGTTGSITSKHWVSQPYLYETSFLKAFEQTYGPVEDYTILALLPSYLERGNSSLVYMVNELIERTKSKDSGFFLDNCSDVIQQLISLEKRGQKTLLIGVSYALLDLVQLQSFQLKNTLVMETGGMKGRRKEMIKEQLHEQLKKGFGVDKIHSEYGMTELLSQAYSVGNGIFTCPPWMRVITRNTEDPLSLIHGKTGGINVIDLANLYSCSFIATQDLGKVHTNQSFEVIGRFDASDIRGCNLMVD